MCRVQCDTKSIVYCRLASYGVPPSLAENTIDSLLKLIPNKDNKNTRYQHANLYLKEYMQSLRFLHNDAYVTDGMETMPTCILDSYFRSLGKTLEDETTEYALEELTHILYEYLGTDINLTEAIVQIVNDAPERLKSRYHMRTILIARAYVTDWLLKRETTYGGYSIRTDTIESTKAKLHIMESLQRSGNTITLEALALDLIQQIPTYRRNHLSHNLWVVAEPQLSVWEEANIEVNV